MRWLLAQAEALLRGKAWMGDPSLKPPTLALPLLILAFAPIYGALMGSYQFYSAERLLQVAYSGTKLPLLLLATTVICLPAFLVLNTLFGLRDDLGEALRAILAGQAGLSIVLASLSPLTRFFYFCTYNYRAALLFNAAMLAIATACAQLIMYRQYRPLLQRHRAHRLMLVFWLVSYSFVGIQMGWTLRPFVGAPGMPVTFFRAEPFTNAYIVVFDLIFR